MYKILLFLLIFLLSSCTWTTTTTLDKEENNSLKQYSNQEYSINLPATWNIIKDTSTILPKPAYWNISLAVTSLQTSDSFLNNFLILSKNEENLLDSKEYSNLNFVWTKDWYYEFNLIAQEEINLTSKKNSILYSFEARYNEKTPKLKFLQTAFICKKTWYILTIALSNSTQDLTKYKDIFKSFSCKE